ncbi:hypothetical protein [Aureimonas endophytica]|nr:hypothetical protein [Aureimonas endophytica]
MASEVRSRPPVVALALVALAASGLDALLLAALGSGILGAGAFLALHLALGAALVALPARVTGDRGTALILGLGLLVLGPFGCLASLVICLADRAAPDDAEARGNWYRQLSGRIEADPAEILYRDIVEGRAYRPGSPPANFAAVMAGRSVDDRQTVLGLLVKQGRPAPEAVMQTALRSRDVAVRASAAAAVARLRELDAAKAGEAEGAR